MNSEVVACAVHKSVTAASTFDCGARTPKTCFAADYLRWSQSSVVNATGFAAQVQVNVVRGWPPPHSFQRSFGALFAI